MLALYLNGLPNQVNFTLQRKCQTLLPGHWMCLVALNCELLQGESVDMPLPKRDLVSGAE